MKWHYYKHERLKLRSVTQLGTMVKRTMIGTAAAMAQNEQTAEEHSTLEQQPTGRFDHPAWCVVWTVQPASTLKYSDYGHRHHSHFSFHLSVGLPLGGARFL